MSRATTSAAFFAGRPGGLRQFLRQPEVLASAPSAAAFVRRRGQGRAVVVFARASSV